MKFSTSLKFNHIFRRLYRTNGQANSCLVLYARKNRNGINRVGITVSKNWVRPWSAIGSAAASGRLTV